MGSPLIVFLETGADDMRLRLRSTSSEADDRSATRWLRSSHEAEALIPDPDFMRTLRFSYDCEERRNSRRLGKPESE